MRTFVEIFNHGLSLLSSGQNEAALTVFDSLVEATVNDPKAIAALGTVYGKLGKQGTSMALLQHACGLAPEDPDAFINYGATFVGGIHRDVKRKALRRGLELQPDSPVCLSNLSGTYVQDGNPQPGVAYGKKAVALDPKLPAGHSNLALCLMELGKWKEAWPHFHGYRWNVVGGYKRQYPCPEWQGQEVDALIIHGEQGLGDEIMFLACVHDALHRVRKSLIIEVAPRLVPLVRRSINDTRVVVIGDEKQFSGKADAWVAMGDLPELLYADQAPPRRVGYIHADLDRVWWWQQWLKQQGNGPYIALAHYGGQKHTHEVTRNPGAADWAPLLDKGTVLSIQYGEKGPERAAQVGVQHVGLAAADLDEQAAFLSACDLLVSVPQTALHLAGALCKPVIGIIGSKPAWRYGLQGSMPWYDDNVELFRQANEEPWKRAIERAAARVAERWGPKA